VGIVAAIIRLRDRQWSSVTQTSECFDVGRSETAVGSKHSVALFGISSGRSFPNQSYHTRSPPAFHWERGHDARNLETKPGDKVHIRYNPTARRAPASSAPWSTSSSAPASWAATSRTCATQTLGRGGGDDAVRHREPRGWEPRGVARGGRAVRAAGGDAERAGRAGPVAALGFSTLRGSRWGVSRLLASI